jgi:GTP-sensing pleiotropic transcriptional regulator CodY
MSDELVEIVGRAIAAADQEDYMEDHARYDARARAAIEAMGRYNMEAMQRAMSELRAAP